MNRINTIKHVDLNEEDIYEAPVLWIKKTFGADKEYITKQVIDGFAVKDVKDVEVIELYITSKKGKDHAYMLLNSSKYSNYLLDGNINITISVKSEEYDEEEEFTLWFEKADHLEPRDDQDPFTLYIWQLPKTNPANQIAEELRILISRWCPINDIFVPTDDEGKGLCKGWAKVEFQYEFDTQKCIYLLNFNFFLNTEIRAGFCNTDRVMVKKKESTNTKKDKTRKGNSRPSKKNSTKYKKSNNKPSKNGWTLVTRK